MSAARTSGRECRCAWWSEPSDERPLIAESAQSGRGERRGTEPKHDEKERMLRELLLDDKYKAVAWRYGAAWQASEARSGRNAAEKRAHKEKKTVK